MMTLARMVQRIRRVRRLEPVRLLAGAQLAGWPSTSVKIGTASRSADRCGAGNRFAGGLDLRDAFQRVRDFEGTAEAVDGAWPVRVLLQIGEGLLDLRAGPQINIDAAFDRFDADAQRFLSVGGVAGAIGPHVEIGDFVVFVL